MNSQLITLIALKPNIYFCCPLKYAPTLRSLAKRAVRQATESDRHIEREVRRRLTMAGPRGTRGEEGGAEKTCGGSASHQPGPVLGEQQDCAIGSRVPREGGSAGRGPLRLEQRSDRRRTFAPRRRCPTTTLPKTTNRPLAEPRKWNTLNGLLIQAQISW